MALLMVMGRAVKNQEPSVYKENSIFEGLFLWIKIAKPYGAIFQVFEGIDVLLTQQGDDTQRVVVNLKPIHYQILDLYGTKTKMLYSRSITAEYRI